MTSQPRDSGINYIETRRNRACSGMGIGMILVDEVYPAFPGDMRNPSAYPYPIQYEICEGVSIHALSSEGRRLCLEPVLQAAKNLERIGCRAIAAECGLFGYFQGDVAGQVEVPVFMSALLQVPFIQQTIGPNRLVGVLTAMSGFVTDALLRGVGIDPCSNIVVGGLQDDFGCRAFDNLWDMGTKPAEPFAFYNDAEEQIVRAAQEFVSAQPMIGALLLSCTGHPPFARAIQRAVDLPIFSWGTLLDFAYSATVHRDYYGHV